MLTHLQSSAKRARTALTSPGLYVELPDLFSGSRVSTNAYRPYPLRGPANRERETDTLRRVSD